MILFFIQSTLLLAVAWVLALLLRQYPNIRVGVIRFSLLATLALPLVQLKFTPQSAPILTVNESFATPPVQFRKTTPNVSQTSPESPMNKAAPVRRWEVDQVLLTIYLIGLSFASSSLLMGVYQLHRIRRKTRSIDSLLVSRIATASGIRPPDVRAGKEIRQPFVAGLRNPTLYVPLDWENEEDEISNQWIARHELAHLAHRDLAWGFLHRLMCVILWPQPFVWLLRGHMSAAEEERCDRQVVLAGVESHLYAQTLLDLQISRAPKLGLGVASSQSSLAKRVEALLDPARQRRARWSGYVSVFVLGLLIFSFQTVTRLVGHARTLSPNVSWEGDWNPSYEMIPYTVSLKNGVQLQADFLFSVKDQVAWDPTGRILNRNRIPGWAAKELPNGTVVKLNVKEPKGVNASIGATGSTILIRKGSCYVLLNKDSLREFTVNASIFPDKPTIVAKLGTSPFDAKVFQLRNGRITLRGLMPTKFRGQVLKWRIQTKHGNLRSPDILFTYPDQFELTSHEKLPTSQVTGVALYVANSDQKVIRGMQLHAPNLPTTTGEFRLGGGELVKVKWLGRGTKSVIQTWDASGRSLGTQRMSFDNWNPALHESSKTPFGALLGISNLKSTETTIEVHALGFHEAGATYGPALTEETPVKVFFDGIGSPSSVAFQLRLASGNWSRVALFHVGNVRDLATVTVPGKNDYLTAFVNVQIPREFWRDDLCAFAISVNGKRFRALSRPNPIAGSSPTVAADFGFAEIKANEVKAIEVFHRPFTDYQLPPLPIKRG